MVRKGFTLLELSIVLIIIGVLTGFGLMKFVNNSVRDIRYNELKREADTTTEKILQYTTQNSFKLPDNDTFLQLEKSDNLTYLHYTPSENIATGDSCYDNTTNLSADICKDNNCNEKTRINNIAFAVVSSGLNKNYETLLSDNIVSYPKGVYIKGYRYDDIINMYTLTELQSHMNCQSDTEVEIGSTIMLPPIIRGLPLDGLRIDNPNPKNPPYEWCVEPFLEHPSDKHLLFASNQSPRNLYIKTSNGDFLNMNNNKCTENSRHWVQTEYITIHAGRQGTDRLPAPNGNYKLLLYLRDNNNKITKSSVIVTISGVIK